MNNLSWLIYLADVVGSVNSVLGFATLMCLLSIPLAFIAKLAADDFLSQKAEDLTAAAKARVLRVMPVVALITVLLNFFVPSRETVYAIAASEMGEEVLKSPTITKAQVALDAWLDKQIGEKPEKEAQ